MKLFKEYSSVNARKSFLNYLKFSDGIAPSSMLTKIVVDFRNLPKFRNANGEMRVGSKIEIKFCGPPNNIGRRMGESPSERSGFTLD